MERIRTRRASGAGVGVGVGVGDSAAVAVDEAVGVGREVCVAGGIVAAAGAGRAGTWQASRTMIKKTNNSELRFGVGVRFVILIYVSF